MRGLRLRELTCSRLPGWEVAGLGPQLRTGLWMLHWSGVSPPLSLYLLKKGGAGSELRQGRAMGMGCTASAPHRPGQGAELGRNISLSPACRAVHLGAAAPWGSGRPGSSPIWAGDLALLLVCKLCSLLEPEISHPANGVITSTG